MEKINSEKIVGNLVDRVTALRGQYVDFCAETGIDYSWLSKFVNRKIKNPRIKTLEALQIAIETWRQDEAA